MDTIATAYPVVERLGWKYECSLTDGGDMVVQLWDLQYIST